MDGDGVLICAGDCDDDDPGVNPAATEECNGLDDDCDGNADSAAVCPCNFETYGGHGYLFCETVSNWYAASDFCDNQDSYTLVTINDSSEQSWVEGVASGLSSSHWWWIGLNDLDNEGSFQWESGSSSGYTNWAGGQPDNYNGLEDCAHIYGTSGTWNDLPCGNDNWYGTHLHSVCESGVD